MDQEHDPPIRVAALHALKYCERLFYLEEVEEIRVADDAVLAGRTLHEELSDGESRSFLLSSERLGIVGRVDAVRHREGGWVPIEHKRGRARRGPGNEPEAWDSDRVQVAAYAMLLEEATGAPVHEGRVRYHSEGVTVRVPIDEEVRQEVLRAVARARVLRASTTRPPVTPHERLCLRCSLAPVCLPEEERLARDDGWQPVRLFPPDHERKVIHVARHGARVSRAGDTLRVEGDEGEARVLPIREIEALILHGNVQVTAQALSLCASHGVGIHWVSSGGRYIAGLASDAGLVQRRLRQYRALSDPAFTLGLSRRLALAKMENQLRFLLRATRGGESRPELVRRAVAILRSEMRSASRAENADSLRGHEGTAARAYFDALSCLLGADVSEALRPSGRTRRPPRDRFNAILSFGYALLYRAVMHALLGVGLEPALGFFHTPRSAAHPLVLDVMELFRVVLWDMVVVASLNRKQWNEGAHFEVAKDHVWLSTEGRKLAIDLFEKRLEECWKHPVTGYSLSYRRTLELEARLLEKEWSGQPGLFARARLR